MDYLIYLFYFTDKDGKLYSTSLSRSSLQIEFNLKNEVLTFELKELKFEFLLKNYLFFLSYNSIHIFDNCLNFFKINKPYLILISLR